MYATLYSPGPPPQPGWDGMGHGGKAVGQGGTGGTGWDGIGQGVGQGKMTGDGVGRGGAG